MTLAKIDNKENNSPFDSIKRISEFGREYWSARELMQILGYVQWRRFNEVIDTAKENLDIQSANTVENFLPVETKSGGRTGLDYHLSRLACYHVALSCDARGKDAVKMAKHYFVIRTREAEVIIPLQSDRIRELELEVQLATALTQKAIAEKAVIDTRNIIVATCPEVIQQKILGYQVIEKPEYIERTITPDGEVCDGVGITYIQRRYGFKSTKEAWGWLERIGMGKLSRAWKPEKKIVEASVLPRDYLRELDAMFDKSSRQMFLGE